MFYCLKIYKHRHKFVLVVLKYLTNVTACFNSVSTNDVIWSPKKVLVSEITIKMKSKPISYSRNSSK